jgi:sugar/nucleoside kinase (ribokinase family)
VIALVGNLARDLIPGYAPRVGGGAFHGARALNRLRVPARIFARCSPADRETLLPPVVALGTPVRYVASQATATFAFEYDGDQRRMSIDSLADPWRPDELPNLPPAIRWIHIAPLARSDFPVETLAALARGRRLSFDAQGLVRASHVGPLELNSDFDPDVLRHLWVLKLADEEAEVVGDPAALPVREVLVTHGSRGSTVYTGGSVEFVPARRVDTEPTGAGDAYCTAYIVARAAGFSPVSAARRATAVVAAVLAARR